MGIESSLSYSYNFLNILIVPSKEYFSIIRVGDKKALFKGWMEQGKMNNIKLMQSEWKLIAAPSFRVVFLSTHQTLYD